ncbi:MAG TPA: ABC-F type ribosomal protection protein [Bacillaceae bacterium]
MVLLEAHHIKLYVKERLLIDADTLKIHKNDRIGLVGKNGSGKSTLLEVLAGKKQPDEGHVTLFGTCELLPQLKRRELTKSGGEITQEYINEALVQEPSILLADEPTTHLDAEHIEWLERKLSGWKGAFVLVSHDRMFLDSLCTKIWEIQDETITEYSGDYSDYANKKEQERKQHEMAYEKFEKKKQQLEEALVQKEKKAARALKAPKRVSLSEARITGAKPYFAKKQKKMQKTAKAIETRMAKLEKVDKIRETPAIKMSLPHEDSFKGRTILRVKELAGSAGKRALWKPATFEVSGGDKVAVIGPNGCGKTTLVEKIVRGETGVTISPAAKIGYFTQNLSILNTDQSILENVRSTSLQDETLIRIILARLHFFREDVHKPVKVLSGGERVKAALAKLFVSDINTLILDEPTNFLDIQSVEALESLLKEYEGTIIFVSHDRRFIERIASRILVFEDSSIKLFDGKYKEYTSFRPKIQRDTKEDARLILETRLTEVLSRLSIEPTEELEEEFQALLAKKRRMESN